MAEDSETPGFRAQVERLLQSAGLLHPDHPYHAPKLLLRLRRVLQLDGEVYREIETDPHGIPQALAIVIATAILAGIGQGSPVLVFLGVAWALLAWLMSAALIWGVGTIVLGRVVEYPPLLVGLGYAYVWTGLLLFARLPGYLGVLASLAALGLCFAAFVQACERALGVPRESALPICAAALVLPFLLLLGALV